MEEKPKRRSGSQKRKRQKVHAVRFSDPEWSEIVAKADHAGVAVSAFMRHATLGAPLPRAARRPTINQKLVARLLGLLGNVASNMNQTARVLNMTGEMRNPETFDDACRAIIEMRAGCMEALGMEKGREGD
ncbi:MAG: hypothetical protein AB7R40_23935 [Nitrospiraceae bacterium]